MRLVKLGRIVNTHGIKGELRMLSDFEFKQKALKPGFKIYINNEPFTIKTYRPHKQFDMITLDGFDNINYVLNLKGKVASINLDDLELTNEVMTTDLIDFNVYDQDILIGKVTDIKKNASQMLLEVTNDSKTCLIPKVDAFIKHIDLEQQRIDIHHWEGLV